MLVPTDLRSYLMIISESYYVFRFHQDFLSRISSEREHSFVVFLKGMYFPMTEVVSVQSRTLVRSHIVTMT